MSKPSKKLSVNQRMGARFLVWMSTNATPAEIAVTKRHMANQQTGRPASPDDRRIGAAMMARLPTDLRNYFVLRGQIDKLKKK